MTARPKRMLDRVALLLFLFSLGALVFGYGLAVGRFRVFPYQWLSDANRGLHELLSIATVSHVHPAWYDFSGARVHDPEAMAPGVTLLTGHWPEANWEPGIRLVDASGRVLHEWITAPRKLWPTSPHTDHAAGTFNTPENYVHGCYLFENGDVVFSLEYLGLVRMNSRGEVVWKLPYRTHHSVTRAEDGTFWVCGIKWIEDTPEGRTRAQRFPGLAFPIVEDHVVNVSEDGQILREISILQALFDSEHRELIWRTKAPRTGDILHINDVEPLPANIAEAYPGLETGDLVVSCCSISTVLVINPETERIKWLSNDFLHQHDPDFHIPGVITVFDNNRDESIDGHVLGGSRIIAVEPHSGTQRVLYPTGNASFYTESGGKFQHLDNGNLLITEACRGRVFEVDRSGNTVWEWVAPLYKKGLVPEILEGTRYPLTPEAIATWR